MALVDSGELCFGSAAFLFHHRIWLGPSNKPCQMGSNLFERLQSDTPIRFSAVCHWLWARALARFSRSEASEKI